MVKGSVERILRRKSYEWNAWRRKKRKKMYILKKLDWSEMRPKSHLTHSLSLVGFTWFPSLTHIFLTLSLPSWPLFGAESHENYSIILCGFKLMVFHLVLTSIGLYGTLFWMPQILLLLPEFHGDSNVNGYERASLFSLISPWEMDEEDKKEAEEFR